MGKASRDKGARHERSIVNAFQEAGIAAERVPLSGGAGGSFCGDVATNWLGLDRKLECKKRASGFKQIYEWLEGNDALVIGADRQRDLVVIPLSSFLEILEAVE